MFDGPNCELQTLNCGWDPDQCPTFLPEQSVEREVCLRLCTVVVGKGTCQS